MINPAVTAALLTASQNEEAEEFLQGKLREAKALGPASAIPFEIDERQQKLLTKSLEKGTIVKTFGGRYYLNEREVSDRKQGQGFMILLILLIAGSLIASIAVLAARLAD